MAKLHFILQGKGGVGKSLAASLLFQYLRAKGANVRAYDTDPVNATLYGYKEFRQNVTLINIMRGKSVDAGRFDSLMNDIVELPPDMHVVIDNGASSFLPLCSYIHDNNCMEILREENHKIYLHTIITGGQALTDTLSGFETLVANFKNVPIVVWLNTYYGEIAVEGMPFEEFGLFKKHNQLIDAIIQIPEYSCEIFEKDMVHLYTIRKSFESYINGSVPFMQRQRVTQYWRGLIKAIDAAGLM